MIRELIISFDYHSGKTVKKLRELELEKKNTEDKEFLENYGIPVGNTLMKTLKDIKPMLGLNP